MLPATVLAVAKYPNAAQWHSTVKMKYKERQLAFAYRLI